jgi:hypothetical protein
MTRSRSSSISRVFLSNSPIHKHRFVHSTITIYHKTTYVLRPREPSAAPPTPPTSDARSSSPTKSSFESPAKSSSIPLHLSPKATVEEVPALQADEGNSVVNSAARDMRRNLKRSAQYALFASGSRDEDCDLPTKRLRILKTTVSQFKSQLYV